MLKRVTTLCASIFLLSQLGLFAQVDLTPAIEKINQEKYAEAQEELSGFLGTKQKNEDEVQYWLGVVSLKQQNFAKAADFFQAGINVKKKSGLNLAGMGLIKMKNEEFTDAYTFLENAISFTKGKDKEVNFAVADAYLEGGPQEIAEAKKILYSIREEDPNDPRTYIKLGEYYKKQGVPELAIEELEKAIEISPEYYPAYAALAELFYEQGKDTRSGEDFQKGYNYVNKSMELKPDYAPAYRIRAELYLISQFPDKFERARNDIQKYLDLTGEDESAQIRYAQFLFLTEDYDKALTQIEKLEGMNASNNVLRRLKGMSLEKLGKQDEAKAAMDSYFEKIDEKYTIALDYEVYGDILRAKGELDKADEYYVKAIRMSTDRDGLFTEIAEEYEGMAKNVEKEAAELEKAAKADNAEAQKFYKEYSILAKKENPTEEDAAKAQELKSKMDAAVAAAKEKLAQSEAKEGEAAPFYMMEARYRKKVIEMADPVTLTHHKDYAYALYKAKEYKKADEAYIAMSKLKPDYMLPYKYRMQCAYFLEKEDEETNDWMAKPVAEDIVKVFDGNTGELDGSDLQTVLVAYEVMATYNFSPSGQDGDYHCSDAKPWIEKILALDPNYARIKPIADYCNQ